MQRVLAYVIDWVILGIIIGLIYSKSSSATDNPGWIGLVLILGYFTLEAALGFNIGKRLCRVRLILHAGDFDRPFKALFRGLLKSVSIIPGVHWAFLLTYIFSASGKSCIDALTSSNVVDHRSTVIRLYKEDQLVNFLVSLFLPPGILVFAIGVLIGAELRPLIIS